MRTFLPHHTVSCALLCEQPVKRGFLDIGTCLWYRALFCYSLLFFAGPISTGSLQQIYEPVADQIQLLTHIWLYDAYATSMLMTGACTVARSSAIGVNWHGLIPLDLNSDHAAMLCVQYRNIAGSSSGAPGVDPPPHRSSHER